MSIPACGNAGSVGEGVGADVGPDVVVGVAVGDGVDEDVDVGVGVDVDVGDGVDVEMVKASTEQAWSSASGDAVSLLASSFKSVSRLKLAASGTLSGAVGAIDPCLD